MTTQETAKNTKTPYFIDYIYSDGLAYFQLVRTKDCAILYANPIEDNVKLYCWRNGIKVEDVVVW